MMASPDFFLVGAAKCGTTSVDQALRKHPELQLPHGIKETYYWVQPKTVLGNGVGYTESQVVTDSWAYGELFGRRDGSVPKRRGEVCNGYLYFYEQTIRNIKSQVGDKKIVIMLRNPVLRAFSGYLHLIREGIVNETFHESLAREPERIAKGYWWAFHIYEIGRYCDAVTAYRRNFSDVAVYLFEDFVTNPRQFYAALLNFIGADSQYPIDGGIQANRTGVPKNPRLWRLLRQDSALKRAAKGVLPTRMQNAIRERLERNVVKPPIDPELASDLWRRYLPDVERLSNELQRDLVELWQIP